MSGEHILKWSKKGCFIVFGVWVTLYDSGLKTSRCTLGRWLFPHPRLWEERPPTCPYTLRPDTCQGIYLILNISPNIAQAHPESRIANHRFLCGSPLHQGFETGFKWRSKPLNNRGRRRNSNHHSPFAFVFGLSRILANSVVRDEGRGILWESVGVIALGGILWYYHRWETGCVMVISSVWMGSVRMLIVIMEMARLMKVN